jgi:GNAT superfamily N-acetyltransferase
MIKLERMESYTPQDLADLGELLLSLSEKFSGAPLNEEILANILADKNAVEIVARDSEKSGKIVGAATLSTVYSLDVERNAYLMSFVVSAETQGQGVGGKIWDEMLNWCRERGIKRLDFSSNEKRESAQHFYLKRGARIYETNFFMKEI